MAEVPDTPLANPLLDRGPTVRPWVLGDDGQIHLKKALESPPNFFAILGLPQRLLLAPDHLDLTFRSLIRALHPDRFHVNGDDAVALAQRHTALVNDAYRTLRDFERRATYVVELGAASATAERYRPTPALLAEVFEINEQIDELAAILAQDGAGDRSEQRLQLASIAAQCHVERAHVQAQLVHAAEQWDVAQAESEHGETTAEQHESVARSLLRAALGHMNYLDNLIQRVQTTRAATAT